MSEPRIQNPDSNTFVVNLPYFIQVSKNKKFYLNLNNYRNAHFMTLNNSKRLFEKQVKSAIENIPPILHFEIEYYLYSPDDRLRDLANVVSIVDKYFCDTLSEVGIIEDDNTNYLRGVSMRFAGIDRINPRVEAHIKVLEFNRKVKPMKLLFNSEELKAILIKQVAGMLPEPEEGVETTYAVSLSEDDEGNVSATVSVNEPEEADAPEAPVKTARRTRRTKAEIQEAEAQKEQVTETPATPVEEPTKEEKPAVEVPVKEEPEPDNPFAGTPAKEVQNENPFANVNSGDSLFGNLTNN